MKIIKLGSYTPCFVKKKLAKNAATLDTKDLTGAVDWRRDGVKHKKNEVFIDVIEKVELLLQAS